jgi:hypothetical protein
VCYIASLEYLEPTQLENYVYIFLLSRRIYRELFFYSATESFHYSAIIKLISLSKLINSLYLDPRVHSNARKSASNLFVLWRANLSKIDNRKVLPVSCETMPRLMLPMYIIIQTVNKRKSTKLQRAYFSKFKTQLIVNRITLR